MVSFPNIFFLIFRYLKGAASYSEIGQLNSDLVVAYLVVCCVQNKVKYSN